jgi:hypothetical protein
MKLNVKKINLIIFGIILAFPILINANFSHFGGYNYENLEVEIESNLKRAGSWDLTGTPIFIDDSDPNYNLLLLTYCKQILLQCRDIWILRLKEFFYLEHG